MHQTNKLNLASNSANEHKQLSSVTLEIFFLSIRHSTGFITESESSHKRDTCNPDGMESMSVFIIQQKLIKCAVSLVLQAIFLALCDFACKNALSRAVARRDSSTRSSWCVSACSENFVRWWSNASTRDSAFFHWTLVEIGQNLDRVVQF